MTSILDFSIDANYGTVINFQATNCTVQTSQTMIECTTAAGFGANLPWTLSMNNQPVLTNGITNETSHQASYDRPTISRILPF